MFFKRLRAEWWAVGIILSLLVVALVHFNVLLRMDNLLYDLSLRSDRKVARPDIVIVAIDDPSIAEIGAWPWSRALEARLIEKVAQARPKAIALNLLLVDPGEPGADAELAKAIGGSSAPVFLPMMVQGADDPTQDRRVVAATPQALFGAAAAGVGQVSLTVDRDGLVRRVYLDIPHAGRDWPHLMRLMAQGQSPAKGGTAPVSSADPVLLPYAAQRGFTRLSAGAVLRGEADLNSLAGKHVLIGVTAAGIESRFSTPLAGDAGFMSGVEIQAHLLNGILDGHLRRQISEFWLCLLSIVPLWLLLLLFRRFSPRVAAVGGLAILLAYLAASIVALVGLDIWVPQSAGLTGMFLAYPLWAWRRLAVAMTYVRDELARFSSEADLPVPPSGRRGHLDPLTRGAQLLSLTIQQARETRRFDTEAVRQLPAATMVIDNHGEIKLANAAADKLFAAQGIAAVEGARFEQLLTVFRLGEDTGQSVHDFLASDGGRRRKQIEVITADQQHFELAVGPYMDSDRRPVAWIVQLSDVTPIKAAYRQREEVLQLLTHDMRSPLISILALLDAENVSGEVKEATAIRRYTGRVLGLADDFVLLARAQAVQYSMEAVCLRSLLEDAADELWPQSEAAGVVIDIEGDDEGFQLVRGDSSLLVRVFVNLIGNALKYAASGKRVACRIDGQLRDGERVARVTIRDWGPGIPSECLAGIFDRFSRAPDRSGAHGAGLGLAFVDVVMRRHGGGVICQNLSGGGLEFVLTFPAIADTVASSAGPQ